MKNNIIIFLGVVLVALFSCENQEVDFPDFEYTTVYFPHQYPLRTLSLGNDRIDNTNDKALKFHIAPVMGGVYENKSNRTVNFEVDESLVDTLKNKDGIDIQALPTNYYTLNPTGSVTIPSGDFRGMIEVQLTEAFLDDTLAFRDVYVLPLKITSKVGIDSILTGLPVVDNPNRHRSADYDGTSTPRDFTLFGIKFVNEYHGSYLRRGLVRTYDNTNTDLGYYAYHKKYVEQDDVYDLITNGRSSVTYSVPRLDTIGTASTNAFNLQLTFNGNSAMVKDLNESSGLINTANSQAAFVEDGDSWGGEQRDVIHLQYEYSEGGFTHVVYDTLVFRDRGIHYEELPIVKPE